MKKTIYSDEYSKLRQWLTEKRHEKGMTQRDLAKVLDVHYSIYAKVESGERRLDVIEYLRVCRVLGIDAHEGLRIIDEEMDKES